MVWSIPYNGNTFIFYIYRKNKGGNEIIMPQKSLIDLLSQEEIDEIVSLYQNNISLREIEKRTGHGRPQITRMLENLGVKTTKGNHYRKYFFDFDFFEKIDCDKKAYWLGFMYADGSIEKKSKYGEQSFKLSLQKSDEEILKNFNEDLKSTYPIYYDDSKHNKNPNHQIQAILNPRKQKTVDDLKKLGCVENKSLILTFPTEDQVPREYVYAFIRGYFDGDGSITQYKNNFTVSIVGTEEFITKLSTYFKGGSILKDKRKKNSWYFNLNGNLQILDFYHKLYDGADRYLLRKYNKFQTLREKYPEREGI